MRWTASDGFPPHSLGVQSRVGEGVGDPLGEGALRAIGPVQVEADGVFALAFAALEIEFGENAIPGVSDEGELEEVIEFLFAEDFAVFGDVLMVFPADTEGVFDGVSSSFGDMDEKAIVVGGEHD